LPVSGRLIGLIAGATAVRVAGAMAAPLLHDEAYYWLWARRLDWSYLDHPPLVAYLIRLAGAGGDSAFWVRLPALVLGIAGAYLFYLLSRELFGERVAFLAAVLYQVAPVLSGFGSFTTPDAPMYVAWMAALLFTWQATHGRPERWWAVGAAVGFGLLSKLYAVLLGVGILLYLLLERRAWLRRREPYAAAALAAVMLVPVVYWNLAHDWAMVRFLLYERSEPGAPPGPGSIVRLLTQHLPLVLFLLPAFIWTVWAAWRRRSDERFGFLLWTSLPALLVPVLLAPTGASRGHLPGPAYIGLAVVMAALWNRAVAVLAAANGAVLAVFVAMLLVPSFPPFPGAREYYGWPEAGARAAQEVQQLGKDAVLAANRYQVAAQLGYFTGDRTPVLLLPSPPSASIWPRPEHHAGASAVAVTYAPERFEWEGCFARVEERPPVAVRVRGRLVQEFRIFRLHGFRAPCPAAGPNRNP
jgi:dolichol-phosphate mannosyltransferase